MSPSAGAERPRWYNALTQNCTTTVWLHMKAVDSSSTLDWRLLTNGYLPDLAYERGTGNTSSGLDWAAVSFITVHAARNRRDRVSSTPCGHSNAQADLTESSKADGEVVRRQLRKADGDADGGQFPRSVHRTSGSVGGANPWRTISVKGALPKRSQDPRSESDRPGAPSSAVDRAVAGGFARDPFCRTTGKGRRCGAQPPAEHRKAQPVDVTSARRTPLPGTDRALFTTARLRSRFGRQAPDRNRGRSRCAR